MLKMTYSLAMAAGRDAGNTNARKHGRSVWSRADYCVAAEVAHKLMYGYGKPDLRRSAPCSVLDAGPL